MTKESLAHAMEVHGSMVYRLALCRMQNQMDAEDVYQDVFLRLLGQETEQWSDERTKAWLIRTTLNRCADIYRFRLRHQTLALEEMTALAQMPETQDAELWEAVSKLPETLRTVIHLYYGEGYATEEIAQIFRIPAVTVRTRLRRARLKLKDLLGGFDDG